MWWEALEQAHLSFLLVFFLDLGVCHYTCPCLHTSNNWFVRFKYIFASGYDRWRNVCSYTTSGIRCPFSSSFWELRYSLTALIFNLHVSSGNWNTVFVLVVLFTVKCVITLTDGSFSALSHLVVGQSCLLVHFLVGWISSIHDLLPKWLRREGISISWVLSYLRPSTYGLHIWDYYFLLKHRWSTMLYQFQAYSKVI